MIGRIGGVGLADFCREFDSLVPIGSVVGLGGVETVTESHAMGGDRRGPMVFVRGVEEAVLIRRLTLPGIEVCSAAEVKAKRSASRRDG
jgi:hypothetical protein